VLFIRTSRSGFVVAGVPEGARSWAQRGSERKACCLVVNSRDTKLKSTAAADIRVMRNKRNIPKRDFLSFRFLEKGRRERIKMSMMFLEIKLTSGAGVLFLSGCLLLVVCGWEREKRKKIRRGMGEALLIMDRSSANLRATSAFGRPQVGRQKSGSHNQVFTCVFCESLGYFYFHPSCEV